VDELEKQAVREEPVTPKAAATDKNDAKEKRDKQKSGKPSVVQRLSSFLTEVRGELRKIVWPDRKELTKKTITVIMTSFLFALIIFGFDSAYNGLLQLFVWFLGGL
jgi:preprotein translocase subunit SecE